MKNNNRLRMTAAVALSEKKFCAAFSEAEYDDMYSIILGHLEKPTAFAIFVIPSFLFDLAGAEDAGTAWFL